MKTLRTLVAETLAVTPETLSDTSSPETIESWDSLNALLLVSELEKNFDVRFTMQEILAVHTYADIKEALRKHGITGGID